NPGKIADWSVAPRWRARISPNRSRKSVVTATSRPSNRCAGSRPGHLPSTFPPFTGPPSATIAVARPWSVPLLPFSRTVRPNSDIVSTTTSRIFSPRSWVSAASACQRSDRACQPVASALLRRSQAERLQVIDGEGGRGAREDARQPWPERHRAERGVLVLAVVLAVAVEPAVRRRLHAGGARLHVVLG